MRLHEVAKNDKALDEYGLDLAKGFVKDAYNIGKGAFDAITGDSDEEKRKKGIHPVPNRPSGKSNRSSNNRPRSSGSDDYDHVINKYKNR